ncbi:MAG: 50S ribosomal protein L11 [Vulcanisaeta sp.]|jgi:large subunit ribosomal protein L11|uniref:Large ribosomal subunit protein uL11 n=1 Tax=Vulcanisaeta moutnovskia (strain 768-28) TaxID=985053 RepID=F0QWZ9_VULM7|nr:50S ribosomal protein L11 [Vulcanisaeta moutnovskia]ADY01117.1 50S ribosomal protein L11 [Vulcanisaeta moutnovskia 768-28]
MAKKVVKIAIAPGKAGGPAVQQLSQYGVDVGKVTEEINKKTKILANYGINNVFVEIEVDEDTKNFEVKPELPSLADLIMKAVGKDTGSHQAVKELIGDISIEKLAEIAYIKWEELRSKNFKNALKQVISACRSIGITINGKDPKQTLKELETGSFDNIISKYEELLKQEGRL